MNKFVGTFVVCMALAWAGATSALAAGTPNPNVAPVNSRPGGLSYGQWTEAWTTWLAGIDSKQSPAFDTTGANCGVHQTAKAWFLAGSGGTGPVVRSCTIPGGKAGIFFPIITNECSDLEGTTPATYPVLLACAQQFAAANVEADLDGVQIADLNSANSPYHISSPSLFGFQAVPGNAITSGMGGTVHASAVDGYWLFLHPLSAGAHTLHFHGEFPAAPFTVDVTYHLTIAG
ncbi:MAG TPA: hypothetical protein VK009_07010 [Chloroflexota bacterium]|nr:hypothetical protein [Chloroflexota bacterium]